MFRPLLPLVVSAVATAAAAITDLRRFRISNRLTLTLLVTGLAYHAVTGGPGGAAVSGLGALTGFGLTYPGYLLHGMGAGDVKLMAGVGAWLGAPLTLAVFLATAVVTGAYALALVVIRGRYRETWRDLRALVRGTTPAGTVEEAIRGRDRLRVVPFAVTVMVGLAALVALTVWWSKS